MSRQISPSTDKVYGLERDQPPLGRVTGHHLLAPSSLGGSCPQATPAARRDGGRRPGGGDPTAARRQPLSWRELPQAVGSTAPCRRPHQRAGRPHGSQAHDGTITTERVDVMWGTDLTSVMTGEGQAAVLS
jgi:hypothetical protein